MKRKTPSAFSIFTGIRTGTAHFPALYSRNPLSTASMTSAIVRSCLKSFRDRIRGIAYTFKPLLLRSPISLYGPAHSGGGSHQSFGIDPDESARTSPFPQQE